MTTVQLQTSFLRPIGADAGHARVTARVLRTGRSLVFGEIEVADAARRSSPRTPPPPTRCSELARVNTRSAPALDYRTAFELAPIGLVLSRQRQIVDCNQQRAGDVRRAARRSWSADRSRCCTRRTSEFERTGERIVASLDAQRLLRRRSGDEAPGRHARRRAVLVPRVGPRADRSEPHAAGIWAFEDLSSRRKLKLDLTPREREIAALLIEGLTSKLIGKRLAHQPAHGRRLPRAADAQGGRRDDAGAGAQAARGLSDFGYGTLRLTCFAS